MTRRASRRTVLLASGAAALAAGCGGGGEGGPSSESPAPDATAGQELASTADIPVGGGTVLKDEKVVVTQPEEGDFRAFSAICTHQNCVVAGVADGTINCACHGSRFRIADGSVDRGPATRALPEQSITVEGNSIRLA
ncbi:Rieske (2Fe-2S) protein [Streptomyces capillispiralis]|uniref:Cytochrome bc1 complex Rieske iron-sulfur subunit n=1 Tax=Streptomyces capillispiralis TaxID=68182 RepID=A0A561TMV7_9ACTN|nr:Rieske (2Fe-2S) protein [Streptomyces capillispiralis]TWF88487.1 Rieske-like 2Fe-2S protein [Streptomyces capillispiralis]GHH92186.1 iron-sulfur protein [Streptomyces capillispiralis]